MGSLSEVDWGSVGLVLLGALIMAAVIVFAAAAWAARFVWAMVGRYAARVLADAAKRSLAARLGHPVASAGEPLSELEEPFQLRPPRVPTNTGARPSPHPREEEPLS